MRNENFKIALRIRPSFKNNKINNDFEVFNEKTIKINETLYNFDYVFNKTACQTDIYNKSVKPLIENFMNGFNSTIFAYGQTGCGKSYTIGSLSEENYNFNKNHLKTINESDGILLRSFNDIFKILRKKDNLNSKVKISFIEIYNEKIVDLLNFDKDGKEILIREDENNKIFFINLKEIEVENIDSIIEYFIRGSSSRKTSATALNKTSSRSHSIFSISLEQTCPSKNRVFCKLNIVDLAGSEAPATSINNILMKEGISINRSLFALRNVIDCLAAKKTYVPYRQSKLTRILQESLGGNVSTLIIACINSESEYLSETKNTLEFACGAKKIENKPIRNVKSSIEEELEKSKEMNMKLIAEIQQLKSKFSKEKNIFDDIIMVDKSTSPIKLAFFDNHQTNNMEKEYLLLKREKILLEFEITQNLNDELELKKVFKSIDLKIQEYVFENHRLILKRHKVSLRKFGFVLMYRCFQYFKETNKDLKCKNIFNAKVFSKQKKVQLVDSNQKHCSHFI